MKFCDCYEKERQENRLRFANIPESYKNVRLKDFSISKYRDQESKQKILFASKAIKLYLSNLDEMLKKGMGLFIYSKTKGSGKTLMAISIANELLQKHQVKFSTSQTILQEIKETYQDRKDLEYTENKLLDDLINAEILVIDDFGTEKVNSWVNDKFYQIINERYLKHRATFFTSNDSIKDLDYDDRITNRIMERVYEIAFPEESIREHIAEENGLELLKMMNGKA